MTGSYQTAFINAFAWNAVNGIMIWGLLIRQNRRQVFA